MSDCCKLFFLSPANHPPLGFISHIYFSRYHANEELACRLANGLHILRFKIRNLTLLIFFQRVYNIHYNIFRQEMEKFKRRNKLLSYWRFFNPQNCECILKFRSAEAVLQQEGCSLVHCYHQKNQKETMLKKWGPCYCQTVQESKHVTYLAFIQQSLQSHNKLVGMIFADKSMIWSSVMGKSAFDSLIWA